MLKFLKFLGAVACTAVLIFVVSIGVLLYKLPSKQRVQQAVAQIEAQTPIVSPAKAEQKSYKIDKGDNPALATPQNEQNKGTKKRQERFAFRTLIDEPKNKIEVCQKNLNKARLHESFKDQNAAASEFISQIDTDDPYLLSFRPPVKYLLQLPKLKTFFEEVDARPDSTDTSPLEKVYFYKKAVLAMKNILNEKKNIELLADRSMDLYVLAELARQKPDIVSDSRVTDFCNEIQDRLATDSPENIAEERSELLQLISNVGLTPEQVNFDPEKHALLSTDLNPMSFQIGLNFKKTE